MESNIAFGILTAVLIISLVVLFLILIVKLYINKIKSYTQLIYEKDIVFQKTLNTTIIETQEQVLTNISQDLHDDAGQQLTFINFQLENLKLDHPDLQEVLNPVSQSVTQLSQSVRRISHSLNHHLLMQQNLLKSISAEVVRLKSNRYIKVELNISDESRDFEGNQQIVIYRIFQEILNNIIKHARATSIKIDIHSLPFKMTVSDNGRGFTLGEGSGKISLGLESMKHRAAMINYELSINSHPGDGTTIELIENK